MLKFLESLMRMLLFLFFSKACESLVGNRAVFIKRSERIGDMMFPAPVFVMGVRLGCVGLKWGCVGLKCLRTCTYSWEPTYTLVVWWDGCNDFLVFLFVPDVRLVSITPGAYQDPYLRLCTFYLIILIQIMEHNKTIILLL